MSEEVGDPAPEQEEDADDVVGEDVAEAAPAGEVVDEAEVGGEAPAGDAPEVAQAAAEDVSDELRPRQFFTLEVPGGSVEISAVWRAAPAAVEDEPAGEGKDEGAGDTSDVVADEGEAPEAAADDADTPDSEAAGSAEGAEGADEPEAAEPAVTS